MLNEKFHKEVKKGLPGSLYFLWSKENFFLEEALLKTIAAVLPPHQKDFNYDVFYPSANPQEILDAALTLPFLTRRRLVVLKNFHEFPKQHTKALSPYLEKKPATTCMLILSQKEPKLDIDVSKYVYPLRIRESDIPVWLNQMAAEKGIKISETAIEHLIESVGTDIGILASEIKKFASSGLKTINDNDVISSTGMTRGYLPFDLLDALIAGQKTRAFRILKTLVEGKAFDSPAVLGTLNWHYRQFYSLWENKGKKPVKMRSTMYRALIKYLPSFTQENFNDIFQTLHEADFRIKTSGRPGLVMEILLIKLLQTGVKN